MGSQFDLAPFGSTSDLCSYSSSLGEEDCTVKNLSGFNWTNLNVTTGLSSCTGVTASSDLFATSTCSVVNGSAVLTFNGVDYSSGAQSFIDTANQLASLCLPSQGCTGGLVQQELLTGNLAASYLPYCASSASGGAGGLPGVLAGCDVEFSFLGDSTGNWPTGTSFSVLAPEPSTTSLLALGLLAMFFVGSRFRKLQSEN